MYCQKCGASLPEGYLYCQKCGYEYQIVPDFDPEIENSIAQTMSFVKDSINKQGEKQSPSNPEDIIPDKEGQKKWIYSVAICIGMLFILVIVGLIFIRDSVFYMERIALKAMKEEDYTTAAKYYDKLRKKEPDNTDWYLKEAQLELLYGDPDTAKQLAYRAISEGAGNQEVYMFLMDLLIHEKAYKEAYDVLQGCQYDKILERYKEYNSRVGKLSHEGGSYDTIIKLTIEEPAKYVYYTVDGTTPDQNSLLYEEPIILGNGTHTISLVSYNEYGVMGELLRKEYTINTTTPLAPLVLPETGELDNPEMIQIQVEPGSQVYYTTDGSIPDENSLLYREPIPIPMGESSYIFIAISENNEKSDITRRSYHLNFTVNISIAEAEDILMEELIQRGHILDKNGAIQDRYGVFRYFYQFPLRINGSNVYVFEEHYLENLIDNPLKNYYGVDVEKRVVYPLKKDFLGSYQVSAFNE